MTILMTADSVGGVWTHALDLVRGLTARGVRVVLAVMGAPLSLEQRLAADQITGLTIVVRPYKLEWMNEPWAEVDKAGAWLLDLGRVWSPDVVHVNGFAHGALPFAAPVLIGAHSCVLSWFHEVKRAPATAEWLRYEQSVKRGLANARLIATPSRTMALYLIRHYAPRSPVVAIHNGRNTTPYAPAPKEPFVLTAGRLWDEAKNVGQLASIAPAIPWPIYVADDGAADMPGVKPLGRLATTALASWYGRAGIYALPARFEPFGLCVLEAALSGCALVLGDIPSLRELWDGAATFVDPEDAMALTRALTRLIEDEAHRELMALLALDRAQRYSVDAMTDAYFAVYRQLASTPLLAIPGRFACAS
jgi:glycosyltransferase involved in cell wall biosynthesis